MFCPRRAMINEKSCPTFVLKLRNFYSNIAQLFANPCAYLSTLERKLCYGRVEKNMCTDECKRLRKILKKRGFIVTFISFVRFVSKLFLRFVSMFF